eukprot:jgi/Undpi1/2495/HiC_scaffold_13.g05874.m1
MGVQPAFRVKKRKLSLAPLEPAPRAPVATFDEPGAAQSGGASGTIASGGVGGISSGLGGDVVASAEQRRGSLDFEGWASETTGSSAADAISATLGGVASHVKDAIKAYEQSTSLPYDDVPPELCLAREGTRSVDLSGWSLLVNDTALRCIAAEDQKRIDGLARQSGVSKVESHIEAMGLTHAFKGVDASGVAQFDASSMVAWRERENLDRIKAEDIQQAQNMFFGSTKVDVRSIMSPAAFCFRAFHGSNNFSLGSNRVKDYLAAKEGLRSVDIAGAEGVGDGGIVALATQCRHLQTLNMSGARRVTDVAIRCLAVNCTGLTRLNLSGCTGICGPGLAAVGECCPKLVDLDISGCKQARTPLLE